MDSCTLYIFNIYLFLVENKGNVGWAILKIKINKRRDLGLHCLMLNIGQYSYQLSFLWQVIYLLSPYLIYKIEL